MKKIVLAIFIMILTVTNIHAQMGIGTTTPDPSAMLDIVSTARGFLMPRMTTAQRIAIVAPTQGLMVYDTDTKSAWQHDGTKWVTVGGMTNVDPMDKNLVQMFGEGTADSPLKIGLSDGDKDGDTFRWDGEEWKIVSKSTMVIGSLESGEGGVQVEGDGTSEKPLKITLMDGTAVNQILRWDGTKWILATIANDFDSLTLDGALEKTGDGTSGNPYKLGLKAGENDKEVLQWNSADAKWVLATVSSNDFDSLTLDGVLEKTGDGTSESPYKLSLKAGQNDKEILQWDSVESKWELATLSNDFDALTLDGAIEKTGDGTSGSPYKLGLKKGQNDKEVLQWDSADAEWKLVTVANDFDALALDGAIEKTGDGTSGSPYKLGLKKGQNDKEILKWNSATTKWELATDTGITSEVDGVIGNEVTGATISGGLKLSGEGTTLKPFTLGLLPGENDKDILRWDRGTSKWKSVSLTSEPVSEVDGVIGNEITEVTPYRGLERNGGGTATSPYTVGLKAGENAGESLHWNQNLSQWGTGYPYQISDADGDTKIMTSLVPNNFNDDYIRFYVRGKMLASMGLHGFHIGEDYSSSVKLSTKFIAVNTKETLGAVSKGITGVMTTLNVRSDASSEAGTYPNKGVYNQVFKSVGSGLIDLGSITGVETLVFRNADVSSDGSTNWDNGTLRALIGQEIKFGHAKEISASFPHTQEMYGLKITPHYQTGRVGTKGTGIYNSGSIFDIFLGAAVKGDMSHEIGEYNTTRHYGIYQEEPLTKNYFAGNVGIGEGRTTPESALEVFGDIKVFFEDGSSQVVPDYVFEKYYTGSSFLKDSYNMMSLSEVAAFTKANNHLPGVLSAAEIKEQGGGISLSSSTFTNLEKIEELFLHTIEQQEIIESLKAENKESNAKYDELKAENTEIKSQLLEIKKLLEEK